ncbi:hypothetical protein WR25_00002 [Diploscapter pachys]|uniref:GYF domain-containing protein n=1 Tax=Diploscapter pachys TaxID=2018661 RepID=A0A2A2LBD1_9BILA|nr:hypothetical protein WR25_00002 [Diploscapter pachys]
MSTGPASAAATGEHNGQPQNSFQPSWLRSTYNAGSVSSPRGSVNDEDSQLISDPIFLQHRYGREDLLALVPRASQPPGGLQACPYFIDRPQCPIVTTPLTELEQTTKNINSSKAMSLLKTVGGAGGQLSGGVGVERGNMYGADRAGMSRSGGVSGSPGNSGGWQSVKSSSWGTNRSGTNSDRGSSGLGAIGSGRGGTRGGYKYGGGPANVGSSPRTTGEHLNGGDEQQGYNRFSYRGRGASFTTRGASTTANSTFNTRAQALYDAKDIGKDRPRNRLRSTSDENHEPSALGNASPPVHKPGGQPTTTQPPAPSTSTNAWGINARNANTSPVKTDPPSASSSSFVNASSPAPSMPAHAPVQSRSMSPPPQPKPQPKPQPPKETNFYYLDPSSKEQGPFSKERMYQWYIGGYFTQDLRVRREEESEFRPLSDLILLNGLKTLFDFAEPASPAAAPAASAAPTASRSLSPTVLPGGANQASIFAQGNPPTGQQTPIFSGLSAGAESLASATAHSPQALAAYLNTGNWGDLASRSGAIFGHPTNYDATVMERQRLAQEQARIEEERRAKEEMQKMLELREAELREKERFVKQQQEEMERKEREMQMELERKKRELEEQQQRIEEERRRTLEEARKREEEAAAAERRERQRKIAEAAKRKAEEEEEEEERRRKQAAELAAEEERERLMHEAEMAAEIIRKKQLAAQQETQRRTAEAAALAAAETEKERERERKRQQDKARREKEQREKPPFVLEEAFQPAQKPKILMPSTQTAVSAASMSSVSDEDAWQTVGGNSKKSDKQAKVAPWAKVVAVQPEKRVGDKSLKEIQEEEERQIRAEVAERERMRKEEDEMQRALKESLSFASVASSRQQQSSGSAWGKQSSGGGSSKWGAIGSEKSVLSSTNSNPLLDGPSLQAAVKKPTTTQVAVAPAPVQKPSAKSAKKSVSEEKKREEDQLIAWFTVRFKKLYAGNDSIELDVFVQFLTGVENPSDVEDYIITYTGDTKEAKQFVKDFLQKRIDMRHKNKEDKDDLSSALVAPATGQANAQGGGGGGGKKKKPKASKTVIDTSLLNFRGTAASNRVNQGEIETIPPASSSRR